MIEIDLRPKANGVWELRVSAYSVGQNEWIPALVMTVYSSLRPSVILR